MLLSPTSISPLLPSLPHFLSLKSIIISIPQLDAESRASLATALASLTSLTFLDLSQTCFDDAGITLLSLSLRNLHLLRSLNFGRVSMGESGAASFAAVLSYVSSLEVLDLTDQLIRSGWTTLAPCLSSLLRLRELHLSENSNEQCRSYRIRLCIGYFTGA